MINQFQKRGYDRSLIKKQINKANLQEREQLLKDEKKETATNVPLSPKYNRTLPKIKEIDMKRWHLLHINPNLAKTFTYFSLPPKQKPQSHYWYQIN